MVRQSSPTGSPRLFALFGVDSAQSDGSPIDTALVIKAVIGVLAAALGAVAVAAGNGGASAANAPPRSRFDSTVVAA